MAYGEPEYSELTPHEHLWLAWAQTEYQTSCKSMSDIDYELSGRGWPRYLINFFRGGFRGEFKPTHVKVMTYVTDGENPPEWKTVMTPICS